MQTELTIQLSAANRLCTESITIGVRKARVSGESSKGENACNPVSRTNFNKIHASQT